MTAQARGSRVSVRAAVDVSSGRRASPEWISANGTPTIMCRTHGGLPSEHHRPHREYGMSYGAAPRYPGRQTRQQPELANGEQLDVFIGGQNGMPKGLMNPNKLLCTPVWAHTPVRRIRGCAAGSVMGFSIRPSI